MKFADTQSLSFTNKQDGFKRQDDFQGSFAKTGPSFHRAEPNTCFVQAKDYAHEICDVGKIGKDAERGTGRSEATRARTKKYAAEFLELNTYVI